MIIYGINNCDKVRHCVRWAKEHSVNYILHDYRKDGISIELINTMLSTLTLDELVNKRSTSWRNLTDSDRETLANETLLAHPTLIKRPLVQVDDHWILGVDENAWHTALQKNG